MASFVVALGLSLSGPLASHAQGDEFSLPAASEFGEVSIETLGMRRAQPRHELDQKPIGMPPSTVDPLSGYPLTQEELSLVFSSASGPLGFTKQPAKSGADGANSGWRAYSLDLDMTRPSADNQNPWAVLSIGAEENREPGVRVGLNPYEEEVTLNWFVGF